MNKKLDLTEYSDEEIVCAVLNLDAFKFSSVVHGIGEAVQKAQQRGQTIAKRMSDREVDEALRRLFNKHKEDEESE